MTLYRRRISRVFFDKSFYPLWIMALLATKVLASLKVIYLGPIGRSVFVAACLSWLISVSGNYIRKGSEYLAEVILTLYLVPILLCPSSFWSWVVVGGTFLWVARRVAIGWTLATERRGHNEIQHCWVQSVAYAMVGVRWGDDLIALAVDHYAAQSRFMVQNTCIRCDLSILGIAMGVALEIVRDKLGRSVFNGSTGINRRQP